MNILKGVISLRVYAEKQPYTPIEISGMRTIKKVGSEKCTAGENS
jgi:hypothetical protein